MSDNIEDENEPGESSVIQQLRSQLREKTDAETRAKDLERKLAFAEAGIPLDDRVKKYFIPQYDGEMTAEAIRAAAEADGFLAPAQSQQETGVTQQEQQGLRNIGEASQGAGAPEVLPADQQQDADLKAAWRSGDIKTPQQIGEWLQQRGEPVAWDGPGTWEDGSQLKPLV